MYILQYNRYTYQVTMMLRHQGIVSKLGMDEFYYILVYGSKTAYFEFKMLIYEHISAKKPCRVGISTSLSKLRN